MEGAPSLLIEDLVAQWRQAILRIAGDRQPLSVLFSGGLDSSLVAAGLRDLVEVNLVTVGVQGSTDMAAAERGARILELPWSGHLISPDDVHRALDIDGVGLSQVSPTSRAVLLGMSLALEATTTERVVCGQGADELFLGYAHFEGLSSADAWACREEDLTRLLRDDWPRSISIASRYGKSLISPFLDPEVLAYVRALSIDELRSGPGRKPLLRRMARLLGLPAELVERPKKAFQYGSGVARLLRDSSRGP
ncbi:MAG: asparagine synthase C-terminal domain-containing protein [Thermoplasmata archaeon]